jgi:glycosyltransferase involved in cell wall biosynthesis
MIKSISLILPAKNEEKKIEETVTEYYEMLKKNSFDFEIIVVVNGSTDNTAKIVERLSKKMNKLRVIEDNSTIHKGGAVELGILKSKYHYVGFVDSDNTFSPNSVLKVINSFEDGFSATIAKKKYHSISRHILSNGLGIITLLLFGLNNTQTGLKVFKKNDVIRTLPLKEKGWIFDVEILWKLKKMNKKVKYVPISMKKNSEGKFALIDVVKMLAGLLRLRFTKIK